MDAESIRRRSRAARVLATAVIVVLLLALGIEGVGIAKAGDPVAQAGFALIFRAPMIVYLWAIWTIRQAFGALAGGALFERVVPLLLGRIGIALAVGAGVNIFGSPLLLRLIARDRFGAIGNFDPAAITLGVVGLMLMILARLLAGAAAMRTELDEIL